MSIALPYRVMQRYSIKGLQKLLDAKFAIRFMICLFDDVAL